LLDIGRELVEKDVQRPLKERLACRVVRAMVRGLKKIDQILVLTMVAYNLTRIAGKNPSAEGWEMRGNGVQKVGNEPKESESLMM
jgi:hypothetical protein